MPSRGQRVLLTQRMNFHANILQGKPQSRRCEPSKSHLRGKSRSYDIAIAARRRLLKFLCTSGARICQKYIARVSFAAPSFPSYASWSGHGRPYRVAPAAGESFGAHICPIPCSLCYFMPSHVHPYPHGPPANVATLPAPLNCTYSVSYTHLTLPTILRV